MADKDFGSVTDKMLKKNLELIWCLSHRRLVYKHDMQEQLPRADILFTNSISSFIVLCYSALIVTFFHIVFWLIFITFWKYQDLFFNLDNDGKIVKLKTSFSDTDKNYRRLFPAADLKTVKVQDFCHIF